MVNDRWKKVMMPSLGNRRKYHGIKASSNTAVCDTHATAPSRDDSEDLYSADDADLDNRVVSALLETSAEMRAGNGDNSSLVSPQTRKLIGSHTSPVLSSSDDSRIPSSPQKPPKEALQSPVIHRKSSKHSFPTVTRDFSKPSPRPSLDGLVRPLPKSQTASSPYISHRTQRPTQSRSNSSLSGVKAYPNGSSPIRKSVRGSRKIPRFMTSVISSQNFTNKLADVAQSSEDAKVPQSKAKKALAVAQSSEDAKVLKSKTKKAFAKFAGMLTEHFGSKTTRKDDSPVNCDPQGKQIINGRSQIVHGLPLKELPLAPLALPSQPAIQAQSKSRMGDEYLTAQEANWSLGRPETGQAMARKRLTVVDEGDFQNDQTLEDPFSEPSPGQHSTGVQRRLKEGRRRERYVSGVQCTVTPSDPFQNEGILDSSMDGMLSVQPVGSSTPRTQPRSLALCQTPTKRGFGVSDSSSDLIALSPVRPSDSPARQRRNAGLCQNRALEDSPDLGQKDSDCSERMSTFPEHRESSDSTRLSSYPPSSTIRHVPRSMGRLNGIPDLPAPAVFNQRRPMPVLRKKHPSPSKGELEVYGKFMEKSLAVYKDADELALSFGMPRPDSNMLSARDPNRLQRGGATSNIDLRKNYSLQGKQSGKPVTRSRIPQPVKQLSRSRTETAFARDFYPANKSDCTTQDELQWDSPAYKITGRCNTCGSTKQAL